MQQLARLRDEVGQWRDVKSAIEDALELIATGDESLEAELAAEVESLSRRVRQMETRALFSGKYDRENAIMALHAGAGGTDAQDWAEMLLRMYLRWAERHRFKTEIVDKMPGEEAGIKSATISIMGEYAYGYLLSERGVHRLVRLSPFDAAKRRHTSFCLVEVWPDVQGEIEIDLRDEDLKIETFRAAGAGGQHVQKNATAVRITHIPTGIVVSCQNERSLTQNRESALRVLKARLLDLERQKQEEEWLALRGEHVSAGWGNQIRSYVLHPYHMVKDLRTGYETGNVQAVLDGDLDDFMEAYLRSRVGQGIPDGGR